MQTANLGLLHVASSQALAEAAVNAALTTLDAAVSGTVALDCSAGGTVVLSDAASATAILRLTGTPAAPFTVLVPAVSRTYAVLNETAQDATVSAGVGLTATVSAGKSGPLVYTPAGLTSPGFAAIGEFKFKPRPLDAKFEADYYSKTAAAAACYTSSFFTSNNTGLQDGMGRACGLRLSNGTHHAIGGAENAGTAFTSAHAVFDESTGEWSVGTNYPILTSGSTIGCSYGDAAYVFGGYGSAFQTAAYRLNADGTWSALAALATARAVHTAAVVNVNRILIAGGRLGVNVASDTTLIYSVDTNSYAAGPALPVGLNFHASASLSNQRALIVGGASDAGADATLTWREQCYIYSDAGAGSFTATTSMPYALLYPVAAALPDGRVLVTGVRRAAGLGAVSVVLVYDVTDESWTEYSALRELRAQPTLSTFSNGNVLISGGGYSDVEWQGGLRTDYCIYNPSAPVFARRIAL